MRRMAERHERRCIHLLSMRRVQDRSGLGCTGLGCSGHLSRHGPECDNRNSNVVSPGTPFAGFRAAVQFELPRVAVSLLRCLAPRACAPGGSEPLGHRPVAVAVAGRVDARTQLCPGVISSLSLSLSRFSLPLPLTHSRVPSQALVHRLSSSARRRQWPCRARVGCATYNPFGTRGAVAGVLRGVAVLLPC